MSLNSNIFTALNCSSADKRRKMEIIINSNGSVTWHEAVKILQNFKDSADKVKVIQILEQRFERMTCQEAAEVLKEFALSGNDRLIALESLKRYLIDHQSTVGVEHLLAAFTTEREKKCALAIAQTVSNFAADKLAAGGHQGYGATGGLYTQSWPLDAHLYGALEDQMQRLPGRGEPSLPVHAKPGQTAALYTSHPSYRYPQDRSCYATRPYMATAPAPENS